MLAAILLLEGVATAGQDKQRIQTILFVCEHGSAKSVIAAAHFNQLAEQRRLPYHAVARGINPGREIRSRSGSISPRID
jgi:protein-tyrosine-phosphatase